MYSFLCLTWTCCKLQIKTASYRRDSWSSFSWTRELSPLSEVAPAGSSLSWSITSRPFCSAIWWIRSSTCSWGVVRVIAELIESSITWCSKETGQKWVGVGNGSELHEAYNRNGQTAGTHRGVDVKVLNLAFKLIHDCRDLLEVHRAQSFVQCLGHLTHAFSHLMKKKQKDKTRNVSCFYSICLRLTKTLIFKFIKTI